MTNLLRRTAAVATLAVVPVLAFGSANAYAGGSPHFIKHATYASLDGSSLVVNFKEAGLSAGAIETVSVGADAATTYECVNGGGSNPAASNKHTYKAQASGVGNFPVDAHGNLQGSLTLAAPSAASLNFSCPPGQDLTLVKVVYSNVTITDETSGATLTLPGTYTYTNPDAPATR